MKKDAKTEREPVAVYEPFHSSLPSLRQYFASLWARRAFIFEYARADLHQKQYGTIFGQLWLIITPLLLAGVYYMLLIIIGVKGGAERFGHLTGTLFLFYLITNSITQGAKSVTSGSKLILNSAFPRLVLPISETLIALMRFLPTLLVLLAIHIALDLPFTTQMFWAPVILILVLAFSLGCAIIASIINVYFRDAQNLLPYVSRTLLYLSPVLYTTEMLDERLDLLTIFNPIFPLLDSWSRAMIQGEAPLMSNLILASGWTLLFFSIGTYIFLSREREFAVRI
jgi:teichoic acid transport system permease protein